MVNKLPGSAYPRVLIINYRPLNIDFATGITIRNLFADWPKDRIAQIYVDEISLDNGLCAHSWQMKFEDRNITGLLRAAIRRYRKTTERVETTHFCAPGQASSQTVAASSRSVRKRITSAVSRLITLLPYAISHELHGWILDFKPDVIYSILEDAHIARLVRDLGVKLNIPVVPHIMDDWLRTNFSGSCNNSILERRLIRDTERLLQCAPVRLGISELMAEEYERRYGLPFLPFMNCVDVRQRTIYSRRPSSSNLFRLAYVGGLHLNRGKALLDIAHVLRELQKEGLHGEIVIYGGRDATEYFTGLNVPATMRFATEDEKSLLDTSNAAVEAFVHVDSFYREDMSYLRFSLSAKIPWCMSAGVPFFAYGPADIGTIKYLRQTGAAVIVDSQDPAFLREELRRLLRDIALQRQLGRAARRMAEDNHDASIVREKFRCVLAAVTTNK